MPKKKSNKPKQYFHGSVNEAHHDNDSFAVGDSVKLLFADPPVIGKIIRLIHGNHGRGRIYAEILTPDNKNVKHPVGRIRKIP